MIYLEYTAVLVVLTLMGWIPIVIFFLILGHGAPVWEKIKNIVFKRSK